MLRSVLLAAVLGGVVLPSGWRLSPPPAAVAVLGTMPQGVAVSPDGSRVAVVDSGILPADVRVFDAATLHAQAVIALPGAFGKPVWIDDAHLVVAGANTNALFEVDVPLKRVRTVALGPQLWPAAVAVHGDRFAVVNDTDASATFGSLGSRFAPFTVRTGAHPSDVAFSKDGTTAYVATREPNAVYAIDVARHAVAARIPVGLHPSALALSSDGRRLFVAESDDDAIAVVDTRTNRIATRIPVGLHAARLRGYGASPNALAVRGDELFVSLGAQNSVALVRGDRLVERIAAGWYPSGVAVSPRDGTLFVVNGKGERAPANPHFDPFDSKTWPTGYVANITVGSLRAIPRSAYADEARPTAAVVGNASPLWTPAPASETVLRSGGPIKHVIYIIKENRSYDQILGDLPGANGDPHLVWFGAATTPNQHAMARRFGIFDNAYANAQISPDGHNWTDAAIANDYVERFWPVISAGRRSLYDMQVGNAPDVPHSGYLWDAAKRARITYRDYGEDLFAPLAGPIKVPVNTMPGLDGHYDPRYIGWDPSYSDSDRFAEWQREFTAFANAGTLPQLEIVYLPDDHTEGTKSKMRTPDAYVAANDWAVGRLVDTVSHSRYWKSTAIFALEDDAQNGPDHVSDQRSTFYVASPYAVRGVHHDHYSTVSVLHSIELILGLPPLSIYDATAEPLYDAFSTSASNTTPFAAVRPAVDMTKINSRAAYGAAISERLDFSRPDAADPRILNDILAHTQGHR